VEKKGGEEGIVGVHGRLKKTSRYWMLARRPERQAAQQKVRRRGQPLTPLSRCHAVSRSTREDTGGQRADASMTQI
jgi:hypothetical protein